MTEPNELVIPPDKFDDYLKRNNSVSGAIYEANKEQFEKAVRDGKIVMKPQPNTVQINVGNKLVSSTLTYYWEWIGDTK